MDMKKIRVLIVEDEILLLKNICKKITQVSSDFIVVGEAFNGKEALEIIENTHPDIVFTDIRMPVMDGIELARILYTEYPNILTVIVSGYDDFEYARTLLAYHVQDYLLKPLAQDELEALLQRLKNIVYKNRLMHYGQLFQSLILGQSVSPSYSPYIEDLSARGIYMFAVCLGNLYLRTPDYFLQPEQKKFVKKQWDILAEELHFDSWYFPQEESNSFLIITRRTDMPVRKQAFLLHRKLIDQMAPSAITICYCDVDDITQSSFYYHEIWKRLKSSLIIGYSTVFDIDETRSFPTVLPKEEAKLFQTMLTSNNQEGLRKFLLDLFQTWETEKYPQDCIDKILLQILTLLQRSLFSSEEDYSSIYRNIFYILETEASLSSSSGEIVLELLSWINRNHSGPSEIENVIEELDTFIHTHYTEDLNISELAERYHFNHSYLTKVFKKQKGESPLQLINSLRIKDAKKMLLNQALSVREISEMLGFSSQHYFSRIFKSYTGQTPLEYRASNIR